MVRAMLQVALLLCVAQAHQLRAPSGKPTDTLVQDEPAVATPAAQQEGVALKAAMGQQKEGAGYPSQEYHHEQFKKEWHEEWKNGDYPGWKITNPKAAAFEDYQSDGRSNKIPHAPPRSGGFRPVAFWILGSLTTYLAL